jgi:hypothetical protein
MADQGAVLPGFSVLEYHPGNAEFPSLPADPFAVLLMEYGVTVPGIDFAAMGDTNDGQPQTRQFHHVQGAGIVPGKSGFADWYLDTLWISPPIADFGDIVNDKDIAVTLHSTFRVNQSLDSMDLSAVPSLSQPPPPTLPENIPSFSSIIVTIRAAAAGEDSFDEFVTFTLSISGTVPYRTLGTRVLFFSGIPQSIVTEQLLFKSDLMRSKDGTEQAFSLRLAPKTRIKYQLKFTNDADRTLAENILFGGSPLLQIGVQNWWETQQTSALTLSTSFAILVNTTEGSWAEGQTISCVLPDRSVLTAEIDTFTPTQINLTAAIGTELPIGTDVMPVNFGYFPRKAALKVSPVNLSTMDVEFVTFTETDQAFLDTAFFDVHPIDGLPIIRKRWILGRKASADITREQSIIDGETGVIAVRGSEPLGEYTTKTTFPLSSKAEIYAYRQFVHFLRGSWGQFYMPTMQNDLPLFTDFVLGGNTFIVPYMGVKLFLDNLAPKRDVRIVTEDGTIYYRRITLVVDNGNDTETLTLDSTVGSSGFSAIASTTISYMHLSRINGDSVTLKHLYAGRADMEWISRSVKA